MQQRTFWRHSQCFGLAALLLLPLPVFCDDTPSMTLITAPTESPPPATADAKTLVEYGRSRGIKGDLKSAIAAFNQAIANDPSFQPAYFNRGYAYMLSSRWQEALADFDHSLQLNPNDLHSYYQRGSLRGQLGDFDGAIDDFLAVIKLDPKSPAAYYNLGHVQYFKGDLDDASMQVDQAISLDPKTYFGYFIRGLVLHAQGDNPGAIIAFEKSSSLGYPYGALWAWAVQMGTHQDGLAQQDLVNATINPKLFPPNVWPSPIADFILKRISQDDLLAAAAPGIADFKNVRLCEAWFFVGVLKRSQGDSAAARDAFSAAVQTQAKSSEEFVEATRELAKLTPSADAN
jgi:lipoprotein NlpI